MRPSRTAASQENADPAAERRIQECVEGITEILNAAPLNPGETQDAEDIAGFEESCQESEATGELNGDGNDEARTNPTETRDDWLAAEVDALESLGVVVLEAFFNTDTIIWIRTSGLTESDAEAVCGAVAGDAEDHFGQLFTVRVYGPSGIERSPSSMHFVTSVD